MNFVSRWSVKNTNVLVFIASESLGKSRHESQLPLSSSTEQQPRTGKLVMDACSPDSSELNDDEKGFSQRWKSDEVLEARTVRLVCEQPN